MSTLAIPIRSELVTEVILRSQGRSNISLMIEQLIEGFLEQTKGDPDIWSEKHAAEVATERADDTLVRLGSLTKGYRWKGVFLSNGTLLKSTYRNSRIPSAQGIAEVRHQQLYFQDKPCSPSQFASRIANNTSRDAWRDILVKRLTDRDWIPAESLRLEETV